MVFPTHQRVSSLDAILSTINIDQQVYRWFTYLIFQPDVVSALEQTGEAHSFYRKLNKLIIVKIFFDLLFIVFLTVTVFLKHYSFLWLSIFFVGIIWKVDALKRQVVIQIARQLLVRDFDETELCQHSLYHLGEIYSRRYGTPSLVDVLFHFDNISRKSFLMALLFSSIIWLFKPWLIIIALILSHYIPYYVFHWSYLYKNLK